MSGAAAAATMASVAASIAMAVSPSTGTVSGSSNAAGPVNITTASVTITPSGGVPAYGHAWAQVGLSGVTWVINSPAAGTTTFTAQNVAEGTQETATFLDTVTDAAGNKGLRQVTAIARHFSGGVL